MQIIFKFLVYSLPFLSDFHATIIIVIPGTYIVHPNRIVNPLKLPIPTCSTELCRRGDQMGKGQRKKNLVKRYVNFGTKALRAHTRLSEPLYFRRLRLRPLKKRLRLRLQVNCKTVNYDFITTISKILFHFYFWLLGNIRAANCTEKLLFFKSSIVKLLLYGTFLSWSRSWSRNSVIILAPAPKHCFLQCCYFES